MSFRKMNNGSSSFLIFLLLGFTITACGGGDGGAGSSNQGVQSSGAASKAVISALGAAQNAGAGNHPAKPSLKSASGSDLSDPARIRRALEGFKRSMQQQRKALHVPSAQDLPCSPGGTGTITTDDQGTPDSADDTFSLSAVNCQLVEGEVTTLLNGSFALEPTEGGFRLTFNNFLDRETHSSGRIEENQTNGTLEFVGEDEGCGEDVFLKNGTLTANLTNSRKLNENGDQVLEVDESSTMTNFTLNVAETHAPAEQGCTPGATTLTLNGATSFTNALNANDSFTANFAGFQMVLTPATRTIDNVARTGVTLSMSGTVTIASPCANGTFTLSTPADDLPFIPDDEDCPVQGRILISDGTSTTAVIATSTGGIQIDDGNNGSIDREFNNCNEAKACT